MDLSSPDFAADPFAGYEALRRLGPVQFLPRHNAWIVLGFDEVAAAFEQPQLFSSKPYEWLDDVLLTAQSARHAVVRRLIAPLFSRAALVRVKASAQRCAADLIKPHLDIVSEYARPVSRTAAAHIIGLSDDHAAQLDASADGALDAATAFEALSRSAYDLADRATMFAELVDRGAGSLTEAEARSLVRLLWLASTATTERLISQCVLRLLQHDPERRRIQEDPALLSPFVEEVVRLHPAEHTLPRLTIAPATLGDIVVPEGQSVLLCVSAANRDPRHFEQPHVLRMDRSPNRHLAFGGGIHRCIGAALAREIAVVALYTLIARAPRFRALQALTTVPYFATAQVLTPQRLMIAT